ncbi:chondroitin-glucuronate 5-epimerase [Galdieria sulphuraria]|uniref:Chondroitin-glucuronate 5-epimerase n=1 Tax=Galdieria sulphuraria TaxID=130081 RepID=M2Y0K6_GALSU|nr:chondroitin-glucuronate 5-epimerase [Galdieria sulphuraria]EME29453.1 chondroitin-glucuronate 5-epimerase [Galdieria sulphuraria]|eukprot:XP_005705973.1 chondroitin-glucuronate 5-epimerase [Galdieria sulphuraria]
MKQVDAAGLEEVNRSDINWKDHVDLNYWTIEYTKIRQNKQICRSVHKVQKRRRMFAVSLQTSHFPVYAVSDILQQSFGAEGKESLVLPTVGTVFVEMERNGKETRWVVFKLYPATMKIKARNDFNVIKTFKWPQENLKVISVGDFVEAAILDSKNVKDVSVKKAFSELDLDYKNLAKLLHFNHSRKKVFLHLGALAKFPLEVYLDASFIYYLTKSNGGDSQNNGVSITNLYKDTVPEPPDLDVFCEFLASLTSLFDGSIKETEHLAIYMLANREFLGRIFYFIKYLIHQCLEEIGRSHHLNEQDEEISLENHVLNALNGFIVLNNLLQFEHNYHNSHTFEPSDWYCYICEEWCFFENLPLFSQFLVILQDVAKKNNMRHFFSRIREVAIEFWTLCFASNICESQFLDEAFQAFLQEKSFYEYVLEPLLKRYANIDLMAVELLQKIFVSEFLKPDFSLEDEACSPWNDKLLPHLSNWLSEISSKTRKSFFSNSLHYLRLRVIYLVLSQTSIFERLLTKNEYLVSFVSAMVNLVQFTFSMLFEYNNIDSFSEADQHHELSNSSYDRKGEVLCFIFQFLSLLGVSNIGHSIFRHILANHFTSQRSLEKLGRVLYKLPLEVNRSMVTNDECRRYHIVYILFESFRAGNGEKRSNDTGFDDFASDLDNFKLSSPCLSETNEKEPSSKSKKPISLYRYYDAICQQAGRMKPMEFSCILEELQDFAKYTLESELMRLNGNDSKPAPFVRLKRNEYICDYIGPIRGKGEMDKVMICHCSSVADLPCCMDSSCLNRVSFTECHPEYCRTGSKCQNQRFQKCEYARVKLFQAGERGWGLKAAEFLPKGTFIIEYQGEVIDTEEYERRKRRYAGERHFYFMSLDSDHMIDASRKSNMARFINHSCQPNCHTEKWTVLGEPCVGIFASQDIEAGTELVFDYNVDRKGVGEESVRCYCGAPKCRNWLTGDGDEKHNERLLQTKRENRIRFLQNTLLQIERRRGVQHCRLESSDVMKQDGVYEASISLDSIPREVKEFQIPKKLRKNSLDQNRREQVNRPPNHSEKTGVPTSFADSSSTISKKSIHTLKEDKYRQKPAPRLSPLKEELNCITETCHSRDRSLESAKGMSYGPPGFGYEFLRLKKRTGGL